MDECVNQRQTDIFDKLAESYTLVAENLARYGNDSEANPSFVAKDELQNIRAMMLDNIRNENEFKRSMKASMKTEEELQAIPDLQIEKVFFQVMLKN